MPNGGEPTELVAPFTIQVENGVELEGFTNGNVTLTANHNYVIHNYYAVPIGDTLTIEPGTVLHFDDNARITVNGYAIAYGTPDSLITFTKGNLANGWGGFYGNIDMKYCRIDNINVTSWSGSNLSCRNMENSILRDNVYTRMIPTGAVTLSNIFNNQGQTHRGINNPPCQTGFGGTERDRYNNHIGNHVYTYNSSEYTWVDNVTAKMSNVFNNSTPYRSCSFMDGHDLPEYINYFQDSIYLGASNENNYRREIYDANTYNTLVFGYFLTDMVMNRPVREAHGIVWKVVVNGYDAQDEFEQLPPLGCGIF